MSVNFLFQMVKSPYLAILLRVYLGIVFIYASLSKIHYPAEFAENIAAYQILPYWSINFTAVFLPWLELVAGLFLVIGLRTKAAASVIACLLIVFIAALLLALFRGLPIGCGCFSTVEEQIGWWEISRDVLWLLFALQIFLYDRKLQLRVERVFSMGRRVSIH